MRYLLAVPMLTALGACGPSQPEPAGKVWYAYDYAPDFGASFTYVIPDSTGTDLLHLFVANGAWQLRTGADFATGTDLATWTVDVSDDDGLVVDGAVVMPGEFEEGTTFDNGEITAIGERKVAIGTFAEVVSVRVDGGPLAGEAGFVIGTGPVLLTIDGVAWETSAYTLP